MPVESLIFSLCVVAAFSVFGATLFWAHRQAH